MTRRLLSAVPALPFDPDARGGSTHAVRAALIGLGRDVPYEELHAASGAALRFAYEDRDGFDPIEEASPIDAVARGFAVAGVRGTWSLDRPVEEVRAAVSDALAAGRPAVTAGLPGYPGRGCQVIAGEDPGRGAWLVQGSFEVAPQEWNEGPTAWSCPVPEAWRAAVPGPEGMHGNPVFLVEAIDDDPGGASRREGIRRAARENPSSPAAYEALIEDLLLPRRLAEGERLGRLDAALAGLAHDRAAAAACLERDEPEAAARFVRMGEILGDLRRRVRCRHVAHQADPDAILSRLDAGPELVFGAARMPDETRARLAAEGVELAEAPWGPVLVVDDPRRRGAAARLVAAVRDLDAEAIALLASRA
jgi:hypothetical protein